jgi:hypothetical protein
VADEHNAAPPAGTDYQRLFEELLADVIQKQPSVDNSDRSKRPWWSYAPRWFRRRMRPLETYVRLSTKLRSAQSPELYAQAYFGLLLHKSDPATAADTAANLEFQVTRNAPISIVLRSASRVFVVAVLLIFSVIIFYWRYPDYSTICDFVTVASAGVVGAIVSLAMRRDEFSELARRPSVYYTYTGILLPMIGGIVACIVYAILKLNMIAVKFGAFQPGDYPPAKGKVLSYLVGCVVVGFLAGFSERWAVGLLGRVTGEDATKK